MLRLILPGGLLTSAQLKAAAQAASELGLESVTLTTGRALGLAGISPDQQAGLLPRFTEAGFSVQDLPAGCPGLGADAAPDPDGVGVREQEQQPGFFTIGVPVLAGELSLGQARKAADGAERYADGQLRITSRQQLLILNVPKEKVLQLMEGLESVDLRVACSVYRRGLTCCAEGVAARARELLEYLEKQVPLKEPLRIHFTAGGCGCEQGLGAEIGLQAARLQVEERMIEAYRLSIGGESVPGLSVVPAGLVKYRLEKLLVRYKKERGPEESFRDFCGRTGGDELSRLLSEEAVHPSTSSG